MPDDDRITAMQVEEEIDIFTEKKEKTLFENVEELENMIKENDAIKKQNKYNLSIEELEKENKPKKRIRKSKEEILTALNDKRTKLLYELNKIDIEIEKKKLTPEEKKEKRRKIDTRCKIIAGATIIKFIKNKEIFDLEKFKQNIFSIINNPDDQDYFKKVFNE